MEFEARRGLQLNDKRDIESCGWGVNGEGSEWGKGERSMAGSDN